MTTPRAELILANGTIRTLDAEAPPAEAVAIANGRLIAVGTLESVEALAHANTRRIDLKGRTLIPGFYPARMALSATTPIEQIMSAALKTGITSIALDQLGPQDLDRCRQLAAERRLPLRVNALAERFSQDRTKFPRPERFESNWLRIDTVRLHSHDAQGEKLRARVWDVHRAGLRAAITASTEAQIEDALSAIEYASRRLASRLRHRIEGFAQPTTDQITRCLRHGIGVTVLPEQHTSLLPRLNGLAVGFDLQASNANSLAWLQTAASQINVARALSICTLGGAQVAGEDALKGSITPGKYADLVVLSGDPLRAPVERIASLWIEMILINGQIVYSM